MCSTHIFCETFSSGLSYKTTTSFTSSNSSFTECVRKHYLYTQLISNSNYNDDSCRTDCTFDHHHLALSTSIPNVKYVFISSKWISCSANYGGGIYLSASNTGPLSVTNGEFYSCTSSYRGGGIYIEIISKVEVTKTLFHACIAQATADYGGGGINIDTIQQFPSIECTSFISCTSGNDGGGVALWTNPQIQKTCLSDSLFIGCKGLSKVGSDGGSFILWRSDAAIGCSNTLFVDSHSEFHGGAISYYIYKTVPHQKSIPLFSFCFFHKNTCSAGNDVFLEEWTPDDPFLLSFSTTSSSRVVYVKDDTNWTNPSAYQNKDN